MSLFEYFLVESRIFGIGFMVLAGNESDLIELMPRYLLEKTEESVKSRRGVHRKVQILQAYLEISPIYYQYVLGTLDSDHWLNLLCLGVISSEGVNSALITGRRQTL